MKKSVLIIEDDIDFQDYYQLMLSDFDVEVVSAGNGQDAFNLIDSGKKFDLILLDVIMPELDGEEFLWKLRSGRKKKIPVIICTVDKYLAQKLIDISKVQGVYIKGENREVLRKLVGEYLW